MKNVSKEDAHVDVDTRKTVITAVTLTNVMIQMEVLADLLPFALIWMVDSSAIVPLDTRGTHSPFVTLTVRDIVTAVTCVS